MFDLILDVARNDERIRAVYMNGSRTNPHVPKDMFQDYDIVYVVTEIASFLQNPDWIRLFGDLLMMQEPDRMDQMRGIGKQVGRSYAYLMLFTDGNRIDLRLQTKEAMAAEYGRDKLTVPLLDKDNCLPPIPPPTDIDYRVKKPTEPQFVSCCNDFWWCLQNVAKGIWRDELPYAKHMFERVVRDNLDEMVSWWVGIRHDFHVSTGKMGKYFKTYLPEPYWEMYKRTYADGDYERMWDAVFVACDLFRTFAKAVAAHFGYRYAENDDANMTAYLRRVRELPGRTKEN
jgi:aminoglycoside 6-adenylyltransferase